MGSHVAQAADTLRQLCLIHGQDLRYIHHAGLRKIGLALLQQHIARRLGPTQIGRNQAHDTRRNRAPVEYVFWTTTQG